MSKSLTFLVPDHIYDNTYGWVLKGLAEPSWTPTDLYYPAAPETVQSLREFFQATPVPPTPADTPEARLKARQAVSQNCAWVLMSLSDQNYFRAKDPNATKYTQFYTVGGSGSPAVGELANAPGLPVSPSGYCYVGSDNQWHPDVNGEADALVAKNAGGPQNVPAPYAA